MRRANRYCFTRCQPKLSWSAKNIYNLSRWRPLTNASSGRPLDTFALQWKCKTQCRLFFNGDVKHRWFRKLFNSAAGRRNIFSTLCENERRVDNALFRAMLAPSVFQARGLVASGQVWINGQRVRMASHMLKDGDLVSLAPKAVDRLVNVNSKNPFAKYWAFVPPYLEVNYPTASFVFLRQPHMSEIPHPFPKLMLEYFAGFYQIH